DIYKYIQIKIKLKIFFIKTQKNTTKNMKSHIKPSTPGSEPQRGDIIQKPHEQRECGVGEPSFFMRLR
uniref:hypothetical protein n=1 Tax=uncultured Muribaculum sp. TaxID=1918613 RepID=UPI0025993791